MFNISLVLILILRSTINDILSKFIKIPLINKGIEFIDYIDNLVISSIPNYFKKSKTPMRSSRNFRQGGPEQSDKKSSDNVFFFLFLFFFFCFFFLVLSLFY